MAMHKHRFLARRDALKHLNPLSRIRHNRLILEKVGEALNAAALITIRRYKDRIAADAAMLNTLSPLAVLERGYSIARIVPAEVIIRDTSTLALGSEVDIRVARGGFRAQVTDIYER
jgi:exodeoxyribonuclease VII large subunit